MEVLGIPREIKNGETRVSLTPKGVALLSAKGIRVLVETHAGQSSQFSDEEYAKSGARIMTSAQELWKKSTFIKKVKEPIESEFSYLRKKLLLFTFLHLASPQERSLTQQLISTKTNALAYETLEILGYTPILKPMSLIAGTIAGFLAGVYRNLVKVDQGQVIQDPLIASLLEDFQYNFPKVPKKFNPGKVVVLGGGQVGIKAAEVSFISGGEVTIYEINERRCRYLRRYFDDQVKVSSVWNDIQERLVDADVLIGGVYVRAQKAPVLVDEALLKLISVQPKLLIDVAADQGGNFFGSRSTTWQNPLYLDSFRNLRFGVSNLPSLCPRYASLALEDATLDYTLALCKGLKNGIKLYPELKTAISTYEGKLVQPQVSQIHHFPFTDLKELL